MTSSWFGKKDDDDPSNASANDDADELIQLTSGLGDVEQRLGDVGRQLAGYLLRRESQAAQGVVQAPSSDSPAVTDDTETALAPVLEKLEQLDKQGDACREAVADLHRLLDGGLRGLADLLATKEAPEAADGPAAGGDWEMAILGPDLTADPQLAFYRNNLLDGVLAGEAGAKAIAGQLLVFQSTPPERLPQLLKDVGEAFYRWRPKTTPEADVMESALVGWLHRACEGVGINNTIDLVHPGERFDSSRHTAASRGVEITQVHGWIVLRDNGKVYTKATVSAG